MKCLYFFNWPLFLGQGRNPGKNFVGNFVQTMAPKRHFEINWPLVSCRFSISYLPTQYLMASYAPVAKYNHFSEFCMSIYDRAIVRFLNLGYVKFWPKPKQHYTGCAISLWTFLEAVLTPQAMDWFRNKN